MSKQYRIDNMTDQPIIEDDLRIILLNTRSYTREGEDRLKRFENAIPRLIEGQKALEEIGNWKGLYEDYNKMYDNKKSQLNSIIELLKSEIKSYENALYREYGHIQSHNTLFARYDTLVTLWHKYQELLPESERIQL